MKVSEIYTYHEDSDQISYIKDGIRIQKNYGDISVKIDIYEDRVRSWDLLELRGKKYNRDIELEVMQWTGI